ncbi:MAG: hypothetical protein FWE22_04930 [Firmicutes bacterium]|nr:hypothetical protein [Bacillota bacterium]
MSIKLKKTICLLLTIALVFSFVLVAFSCENEYDYCGICEEYPCVCVVVCVDCEEYPCVCPEVCVDCEEYPCVCVVVCVDCEEYPCTCVPEDSMRVLSAPQDFYLEEGILSWRRDDDCINVRISVHPADQTVSVLAKTGDYDEIDLLTLPLAIGLNSISVVSLGGRTIYIDGIETLLIDSMPSPFLITVDEYSLDEPYDFEIYEYRQVDFRVNFNSREQSVYIRRSGDFELVQRGTAWSVNVRDLELIEGQNTLKVISHGGLGLYDGIIVYFTDSEAEFYINVIEKRTMPLIAPHDFRFNLAGYEVLWSEDRFALGFPRVYIQSAESKTFVKTASQFSGEVPIDDLGLEEGYNFLKVITHGGNQSFRDGILTTYSDAEAVFPIYIADTDYRQIPIPTNIFRLSDQIVLWSFYRNNSDSIVYIKICGTDEFVDVTTLDESAVFEGAFSVYNLGLPQGEHVVRIKTKGGGQIVDSSTNTLINFLDSDPIYIVITIGSHGNITVIRPYVI